MIDAKSLRIGNWVKHGEVPSASEYPGTLFQWSVDHWYDIATRKLHYASLEPIPLDTEILEKCGFKYGKSKGISSFEDGEEQKKGWTHYWDKRIIGTELVDSHSISLVKWGKQEYFTFQLERGFYRQRIKYLHQLQNLYWCLCGEELKISL